MLFLFSANFASAHATGQSLIQKVPDYLVDIGYDSLLPSPVAGEPTLFDLTLYDSLNNPVEFTEVILDVGMEPEPITFYGAIKTKAMGPNTFIYTFPKGGLYKFRVRYKNGDESLAEAIFKLDVLKADYETPPDDPKKYWTNFLSGAIVGIVLIGFILGLRSLFRGKK